MRYCFAVCGCALTGCAVNPCWARCLLCSCWTRPRAGCLLALGHGPASGLSTPVGAASGLAALDWPMRRSAPAASRVGLGLLVCGQAGSAAFAWQLVLLSGAPSVDPWVKIKIRPKPVRFRVSEPKNPCAQTKTQNRNPKPEIRRYPPQTRPTAILTHRRVQRHPARGGGRERSIQR